MSDPKSNYCDFEDRVWHRIYAGLAMQAMISNCPDDTAGAVKAFNAIPELAHKMAKSMIIEGRKGGE